MLTYPGSGPRKGMRNEVDRDQIREQARVRLASAHSFEEMVALVGAGPVWCGSGETVSCGWRAMR